jgi:heptosyltransferase-2
MLSPFFYEKYKMKILVIALSGIGDALMFTPSLKKLHEDFPSAQIDLLAMYKGVKDIYQNLPGVNNVLFHDFLNSPKLKSLSFVLNLRNKYDISISVYPSNRRVNTLINWLIGAKKRGAISYLRRNFVNLRFLNNITIKENDLLHNVEENIRLSELISGKKAVSISPLQLILSESDLAYADIFLTSHSIKNDEIVIGFHPGCSPLKNHEKRRWETEKFARLGNKLIDTYNAKLFVFGGKEENNIKAEICSRINSEKVYNIVTDSLLHTAAVMKRCNLFITNDSSLMHVAAGLKLKTIAILGPTNKSYIYPWQTEYKIASLDLECSPCFYYSPKPLMCTRIDVQFKCIKELNVYLVFEKAKDFFEVNSLSEN